VLPSWFSGCQFCVSSLEIQGRLSSGPRRSRRGRYLLKQHLVRLRQIEGFGVGLLPAQISGGPVNFDHVAIRVVEIEGEGLVVIEYKLDRDSLLHDSRVEGSELGE
jgi:hypothetical protein